MALNIKVSRQELYAALSSIQNITGKKGTMAILANVLITTDNNTITLSATDLEIAIKTKVEAEILEPGSITLPARKLFEVVRESDCEFISIEEREKCWVRLIAGKNKCNIAGIKADEFPNFPEHNKEAMVEFSSDFIREMIDKTIFSVAGEGESQFTLSGVLVEGDKNEEGTDILRFVSSDGHRLTVMEKECESSLEVFDFSSPIIIPRKGLQEIKKLSDSAELMRIGFQGKQMVILCENSLMIIRLISGDFPDYRNILSMIEKTNSMKVNREALYDAVKFMNLFSEDRFNLIKFEISKELLILSSESTDENGDSKIDISYIGENIKVGFNGRYFIDVLSVMLGENIDIYIKSEENPCMIESEEDPGFLSIIMPMKI